MPTARSRFLSALPLLLLAAPAFSADPTFTKEQVAFFDDKVLPVLKANCLKCHGDDPKKLKGELDLRTRAGVLKGGETGPAAVPGKAADSLLVQAIGHKKAGYEMPPMGKLKDENIAVLTKWVQDGLAFPADKLGETVAAAEPKKRPITDEQRKYWAYQPVKRPAVPKSPDAKGAVHPIDAFLLDKMAGKKLTPVGEADKATLIRRVCYDLTGLPPTPEEIDAFVKDADPKAWEKLIDSLLASPAYGEKWGRHWLDVVRFAETNGYERDGPKANAWRYRDYVIRSFNSDKPYDRFVREQVAGDEMPRKGDDADPITATGFYRLGVWDDEPADRLQAQFDGYDDIVTVTGQAFLGMTLNCARCHDHKGDPIYQTDYYRMVALVRDLREHSYDTNPKTSSNQTDISPADARKGYEKELGERLARIADIGKRMVEIEDAEIKTMTAEDQRASEGVDRPKVVLKVVPRLTGDVKKEYAKLKKEADDLRKKPAPPNQELALSVNNCDPNPPPTFVNVRGNPHANGPEVKPGFPEILGVPDPKAVPPVNGAKTSGRRTALADWLAGKDNPLTARVMMNRVWLHHFGRGLVPTPNDFGKLGEPVTHPELLDWLAAEFMDGGWTLKRMHKLVLTSAAYKRASTADAADLKADPANHLLWRFNMRRLSAEEVRDSFLVASGTLVRRQGGPSMYPKLSAEVLAGISFGDKKTHWPDSAPDEENRRTVYAFVKRSIQVPILSVHDQADTDNSCPVRYTTTVPTQALGMLNGEFANAQAELLAKRMAKDAGGDLAAQVARGIRLTTGRVPPQAEVDKDVAFVRSLKAKHGLADATALAQYALLLLNANEFAYVD